MRIMFEYVTNKDFKCILEKPIIIYYNFKVMF